MQQQAITVLGMSCGHCKNAVEKAAKGIDGVKDAIVDLEAKTLRVEFDPAKASLEKIKAAVEEEGFTVQM